MYTLKKNANNLLDLHNKDSSLHQITFPTSDALVNYDFKERNEANVTPTINP
jgi:hypothetical protein